jgi:ADP-heptose:LPS heptosyltransferase
VKKIFLDLSECKALGDTICSTPVIRKLQAAYEQQITVITNYPEVFIGNPCVERTYAPNAINMDFLKKNHIVHNSFYNIGKKNERGVEMKHNRIDIRQFHAINLGFMLLPEEMQCSFYPKPKEREIPYRYVLIHPVQTWESRTWQAEKWMQLTEMLNKSGIHVISVGKDDSETGFFNVKKPVFNFEIGLGMNLMNKTSLHETWHLINDSICFVSMDSGLLHLAGTTNAQIIQLGSSIYPSFRKPYRFASQDYKYDYINGECDLFCASNMKYGVRQWGDIQGVPPLVGCLEKKKTYECQPNVIQVFNKIIKYIHTGVIGLHFGTGKNLWVVSNEGTSSINLKT